MAQIEKRSENIYRILVSCGRQPNGRQNYKRKTITLESNLSPKEREKELLRQSVLFEEEVKGGKYLDGQNVKFSDFTADWLKNHAEKQLAPKTILTYKNFLDNRILPAIGHIRIGKLSPMHIMQMLNNLSEEGMKKGGGKLSARSIRYCHQITSSIMGSAVNWQIILDNPCRRVKSPRDKSNKLKHLDEYQTILFLEAISKEELKYILLANMVIYGGFREGEVVALSWDDIDFENLTVRISKSSTYIPKEGITIKEPKTQSSNRIITLPDSVMDMLRLHRKEQLEQRLKCANLWQDSNLIFTQWNGKPMHPQTPYKWIKKFIESYNNKINADKDIEDKKRPELLLPPISFHALRHTNATLLVSQKVDIKTISNRLGHSMTSTTMNIYAHSLKSADKAASEALDDLLGGKLKKNA